MFRDLTPAIVAQLNMDADAYLAARRDMETAREVVRQKRQAVLRALDEPCKK